MVVEERHCKEGIWQLVGFGRRGQWVARDNAKILRVDCGRVVPLRDKEMKRGTN